MLPLSNRNAARAAFSAVVGLLPTAVLAGNCVDVGLAPDSGGIVQLREAAQPERPAMVYRKPGQEAWFLPLRGEQPGRSSCQFAGETYWKVDARDAAMSFDTDTDMLTFLDLSRATNVIDGRIRPAASQNSVLDSMGINYQLGLNYSGARANPAATSEIYAYNSGWYFDTNLAWNNNGKVARYESYALRQSVATGTFLRLGDSITSPTALGEALQFAGMSWGTDRNLRPGDFSPVLPTLRSGNALAGPLEVFINDNLQFQQTLQNGVYDLRNIPAQQGFNTYTVRTLDAQGNPVTVQREIYLPASLLPPGIQSWRVDAGFQREDFFTSNAKYGAPLVSGSYASGLSHDTTVSAQALVTREITTASAGYDRRLTALWTGHLGLLGARKAGQQGSALQARFEGGSRWWQLLADWTQSFTPLPGLGNRPAIVMQRLLRAQWSGIPGVSIGATIAQSTRDGSGQEDVATLTASTRVFETGAVLAASLVQTRSALSRQKNVTVSVIVPLSPTTEQRNRTLYASQNSVDGAQLSRVQYNDNGQTAQNGNWGLGTTYDSRGNSSAIDGTWSRSTDKLELDASARAGTNNKSVQLSVRSGLIWTAGSTFTTRPIAGAFALVSTGQKDVPVFYENRPAGSTNERGLLLIPGLIATGINRIRLDPSSWPIEWTSSEVEKQVVPPLGGGVLVSFKINAEAWPSQTFLKPVQTNGKPFPPGTLVHALVDGDKRETVVDREGHVWIGELMPAASFNIGYQGKNCEFSFPPMNDSAEVPQISPNRCEGMP